MLSYASIMIISMMITLLLIVLMNMTSLKSKKDSEKLSPFECGFLGYEESRSPFSVHFFLVGLIFLIFDIELVLLFPYLSFMKNGGNPSLVFSLMFFLTLLSSGLFIEWEKSFLEWRK